MLRILIISYECWRDDSNGGNVLSNIFEGFAGVDVEFAQIYCKPGEPQNLLCKSYFHMTDKTVLLNLLKHTPVGKKVDYSAPPKGEYGLTQQENGQVKFYDFFRQHNLECFYVIRELLWKMSQWKSPELEDFIKSFSPNIIFAPCYASHFMLALDRYVTTLAEAPAVSYISDDNYSLKQLRLSPIYWLNRFILRRNIRKTVPYYQWIYTMTQQQEKEMHQALGVDMRILRKAGELWECTAEEKASKPKTVRFIYAGGTYLGRDKILARVARQIEKLKKQEGIAAELHIYTTCKLSSKMNNILNNGTCTFTHPAVPMEELKLCYCKSDVALHVESFRLKYALQTRLSFSTKIVDCLSSGCAVLAICPAINAGFQYLKQEDAALCVCEAKALPNEVRRICKDNQLRQYYKKQARNCLHRNHAKEKNLVVLYEELYKIANLN